MPITEIIPKLKGHLPDNIYDQISGILSFGIDGPKRLSNFLGQASHESANFSVFTENLNYSAHGLLTTFSKYFNITTAAQYEKQPERIANRVYANRMGNGDEQSGDGYRYRGRGALQTTGKNNYDTLGKFLGVDLITNPELVATEYQLASAAFFFKNNGLWVICDKGIDTDTITQLTKRINGGDNGLSDRIQKTQNFYNILIS